MIINLVFVGNDFKSENQNKRLNYYYEYFSFDKNEFKKMLDSDFSTNIKIYLSDKLNNSELNWTFHQFEIEFINNTINIINFKKINNEDLKKLIMLS